MEFFCPPQFRYFMRNLKPLKLSKFVFPFWVWSPKSFSWQKRDSNCEEKFCSFSVSHGKFKVGHFEEFFKICSLSCFRHGISSLWFNMAFRVLARHLNVFGFLRGLYLRILQLKVEKLVILTMCMMDRRTQIYKKKLKFFNF